MFWKKKDKTNESVYSYDTESQSTSFAPPYSPAPSYTSAPSYSSPALDQHDSQPAYPSSGGGRYGRSNQSEADQRNQLLGGASGRRNNSDYSSRGNGANRDYDYNGANNRHDGNQYGNGEDDDEDEEAQIAGTKQQIRNIKQDSLASTRAALQKLQETENSASKTMNMLGEQSTQLANINRHLDLTKAYADRADSQTNELKKINRSIFIPVVSNPFNSKSRDRKRMEELERDHKEHMQERDNIRQSEYETNARIEETHRQNRNTQNRPREGRSRGDSKRYQFEADEEDDAIEDELDDNLGLMGDALSNLKNMAITMNTTLDRQNVSLDKMNRDVDPLNAKLRTTTGKLNNIR